MRLNNILFLSLLLTFSISSIANESKKVKSNIEKVTVFRKQAQIDRKSTINLNKGRSTIEFTNLSPYVIGSTVRVKTKSKCKILSVNHYNKFIKPQSKSKKQIELENMIEYILNEIENQRTLLKITEEELSFLKNNQYIGGKEKSVSSTDFRAIAEYYSVRINKLTMKSLGITRKSRKLSKKHTKLKEQLDSIQPDLGKQIGIIKIKLETKNVTQAKFNISYTVKNAGWNPKYDVRSSDINTPIELGYKAEVYQNTKVDWKNVNLSFSSTNPTDSKVAPELKKHTLNYNTYPPVYKTKKIPFVQGQIVDANDGTTLPGVSISVSGSSIGTTTDANGRFSITLPNNPGHLKISYIGYQSKHVPIHDEYLNIRLTPSFESLEEVVVLGYGTAKKSRGRFKKRKSKNAMPQQKITQSYQTESRVIRSDSQTAFEFEVDDKYNIKSNGNKETIDMVTYTIPTKYTYLSIPRIEQQAFLIAELSDWKDLNLINGEANLFFEDTFIGKTLLNINSNNKNIKLSLGTDKQISVKRERIDNSSDKKFFSSKQKVKKGWKTTIHNSKNQPINLIVKDQIPVSVNEDITVEVLESTEGNIDSNSGFVKWELKLPSDKKKEIKLQYEVKYPKDRYLRLE